MGMQNIEIEVWQDADGIVTADGADDRFDLRVANACSRSFARACGWALSQSASLNVCGISTTCRPKISSSWRLPV
jgi:hypothetical protein